MAWPSPLWATKVTNDPRADIAPALIAAVCERASSVSGSPALGIQATISPMTVAERFFHAHGMPSDVLPELCRRFHVRRLDLFGSAATGHNFDPVRSDLDFLVSFEPLPPGEYAIFRPV
jgi:hypothetical protein